MRQLYYVESIKQYEDNIIALLLYIPNNIDNWVNTNKDFKRYIKVMYPLDRLQTIREGGYIYKSNHGECEIADNDYRVTQIRERYYRLIDNLMPNIVETPNFSYNNVNLLCSYHINVGHGNHSLLVFESNGRVHIWMVDSSDYDFISHRYYRNNINDCLTHIKHKFQLTDPIHIDVVMLTHPHYDHYSGFNYYINTNMIDNKTVVYINLRHKIANHNFNNLLSQLNNLGVVIIEPFRQNSCNNIRILYPDSQNINNNLSLNDLSSVYNISFDEESFFVFPGDIETAGWKSMDVHACCPYMTTPHFYAISHHGSINGHKRNMLCQCSHAYINDIKDCLHKNTITVLMGRDKAFSGIYAQQVLNDFKGRILFSEKNPHNQTVKFLEIDLISKAYQWY